MDPETHPNITDRTNAMMHGICLTTDNKWDLRLLPGYLELSFHNFENCISEVAALPFLFDPS
jgi:hypothetical protein